MVGGNLAACVMGKRGYKEEAKGPRGTTFVLHVSFVHGRGDTAYGAGQQQQQASSTRPTRSTAHGYLPVGVAVLKQCHTLLVLTSSPHDIRDTNFTIVPITNASG